MMAAAVDDVKGAPLRRVISDTDEMMDVVSSSSAENSPLPPRKTSHSMFPSFSLSPMRALHSSENVTMMDSRGVFLPSDDDDDDDDSARCQPSPLHTSEESTGLIPKIMAPLHRCSQMVGFSAMDAEGALFPTRIITTHENQHGDDDDSGANEDDTVSITSAQSCNSNSNNHNPLMANFTMSSQRSFQSQRSGVSAKSHSSSRSTQSWGQLTEIDLPPKVNDMEAPTYVLEESPSSQNLWKQTAGNRPPQPIEERAFFEKMWAENFARSQVKYGVPVQDLVNSAAVAASPNVVEDEDTAGSDRMYSSLFSIATPSHRTVRQEDVAEAILISRMNDLSSGLDSSSPRMNVLQRQLLDKDTTILDKGINAFGTTVSKSFAQADGDGLISVTTVNVSVASYRVVESKRHGRYAQFHVIYREGNMRDTIGVWKRYRDFEMLASKISDTCEGCSMLHGSHHVIEPEVEHLPNAITSWRLMKKRKRWYRCLDAGYLSLKVFLLERFLHDVLFESSSPFLLREFVLTSVGDDSSPSVPNSP